jgi:hypothetical protein
VLFFSNRELSKRKQVNFVAIFVAMYWRIAIELTILQ